MAKKTRTILFLIFLFLFLLGGPSIVFYSLGYRIDFNPPAGGKRITQTGAFYFKVFPKNAEIYLDGKLIKKTDWFFGASFIENLLPKKYTVEIKKQGFSPWKKTLPIKEKGVVEAKNITLVPENLDFTILMKEIEDFWFSPDRKKMVLKTTTQPPPFSPSALPEEENGWEIKLYDTERKVKSHLFDKTEISKQEVNLLSLDFSTDSERILLKTESSKKFKYFILDLTEEPPELVSLDFLETNDQDISFNPKDPQKIFILKNNTLFQGDLIKNEISLPLLSNVVCYKISNENIYYLENSGYFFKTDFSFSLKEKISDAHFLIKKQGNYEINIFGDKIFLKENNVLYSLNQKEESFEKISENVRSQKISPDQKKLVYFSDYEIWILFLKEIYNQPQKKEGEKLFLIRVSEKIKDCSWLDSHYLIFSVGNEIKVIEIDDRDNINIANLPQFENPRIFFNRNNQTLYLLSEGKLYTGKLLF